MKLLQTRIVRRAAAVLGVLCLSACASPGDEAATGVASAQSKTQAPAPKLDENGTPGARLLASYADLQTKLAKDDVVGARTAFKVLSAAVSPESLADSGLRDRVSSAAKRGEAAKDLAAARTAFRDLSEAVIAWLSAQPNPASAPLYLAHCPMAFDTGAKWLQATDRLQNPYYGSEMLTCGRIERSVKPGEKLPAK